MDHQNNEYSYNYTQGNTVNTEAETVSGYNANTNYNSNANSEYAYSYTTNPKPKKKKKAPRWLKVVGLAVLFGIVASGVFVAGNFVAGKILGTDDKKGASKVENTALTTSNGDIVTSDVSEMVKNTMPSVVSITNMSVQQVQNFFGGVQEYESESAGSGIIIAQNECYYH